MPVIIENKSDKRVLLRFNSGRTRRLAPHETERAEHVEVKGNDQIQRLKDRHLIAVQATPRSGDMTAAEAVEHIENAPPEALHDFLSPDEDRKTVLQAMEERRAK